VAALESFPIVAAGPSGSAAASDAAGAVPCATAAVPTDGELDAIQLDAAKLHAYQVALELHGLCCTLASPLTRITRDQLERASLSVVLNTAEAAGRRSRRSKAYFFMTARGSATEVAALLDVLALRRLAPPAALRNGRRLAIRCVQMLTRVHQKLV
jgi:four helix bundle protein